MALLLTTQYLRCQVEEKYDFFKNDNYLIMKSSIDNNNEYDEKTQKVHESELTNIKKIIENVMVRIDNISTDKVK